MDLQLLEEGDRSATRGDRSREPIVLGDVGVGELEENESSKREGEEGTSSFLSEGKSPRAKRVSEIGLNES